MEQLPRNNRLIADADWILPPETEIEKCAELGEAARIAKRFVLQRAQFSCESIWHRICASARDESLQCADWLGKCHRFQLTHWRHLGDLSIAQKQARFCVFVGQAFDIEGQHVVEGRLRILWKPSIPHP